MVEENTKQILSSHKLLFKSPDIVLNFLHLHICKKKNYSKEDSTRNNIKKNCISS